MLKLQWKIQPYISFTTIIAGGAFLEAGHLINTIRCLRTLTNGYGVFFIGRLFCVNSCN